MSFDDTVRKVLYPGTVSEFIDCREHLNFVCLFNLQGWEDQEVVLSFASTGYKYGRNLINFANVRRENGVQVPMYLCQFELFSRYVKDPINNWYVPVAENPMTYPNKVDDMFMQRNLELHKTHAEIHRQRVERDLNSPEPEIVPETNVIEATSIATVPPHQQEGVPPSSKIPF